MNLTKKRLHKIINSAGKQTRKKYKKSSKIMKHSNTARQKRHFNLKKMSLKNVM